MPSTLTVLNTNDSGPGSLRAEIAAAQSGDTIVFDQNLLTPYQALPLTSGELAINKSLTIQWTGPTELFIFNNAGRVFEVNSKSASVTLSNLNIAGSATSGGGIENEGFLTVNNSDISGIATASKPNAKDGVGGAIYNLGTMVINNTNVIGGGATGNGGGIENQGSMTITNSSFIADSTSHDGGAIDNQGVLSISGCSFSYRGAIAFLWNAANFGSGGDIANYGKLTVTDSLFTSASAMNGGAIANFGNAVLDGCTIDGGVQFLLAGNGSGVYNVGSMTISNSTIEGCFSYTDGGGIYNAGSLTLSASTVTGNSAGTAGGGIYNTGKLYVTNGSSVTGNSAPSGADLYNLGTFFVSSDSTVGIIGP